MLLKQNSVTIKSYSKINLTLHVEGKREDGYHLLDMVILPFSVHDVIEVRRDPYAKETMVTCDEPFSLKDHNNLCLRAVRAMREEFGFKDHFRISIHKEIPFAAGLGGGSSNAAAVMKAINKILGLNASLETLERIGLTLGADVPYFFHLVPARVGGIGEKISKINCKKPLYCLVIKPSKGLKTRDVFEAVDAFPIQESKVNEAIQALENENWNQLANAIQNDLYAPALTLYPELKDVVSALKKAGFPISSMTGSGSCCFALSDNKKDVLLAERRLSDQGYDVYVGKTDCKEDLKAI